MNAAAKTTRTPTLARTAAPEDIVRGDYVALLSIEHELPLLVWLCDPPSTEREEVVRVRQRTDLCREPLHVRDVCLPFVSAERPGGARVTLDVRSCELAKLDHGYGRRVSKALAPKRAKKSRKRRNKK